MTAIDKAILAALATDDRRSSTLVDRLAGIHNKDATRVALRRLARWGYVASIVEHRPHMRAERCAWWSIVPPG